MTETEFLSLIDATLSQIEDVFEGAGQRGDIDVECSRNGSLLDIEFLHNKSKIIINSQAALSELWVAAKSGGFHYKHDGRQWLNTRDGSELMAVLAGIALEQGGLVIDLG
ncbi:iron donor protein CyaY [Solimicrobium silvestre]|uniref:Iron-sulfur cluster assembly protein CyaY n=1 Tax=Solimicrobium silvestre TaxID=2099400 RepID=A0A2S9H462_9BURK|nr:iron donor protein CyaY [Solimicrobium silvestre]PRC94775.1 Iron donor protein CyaY [Solimicrobium silvestre]